MHFTKRRLGILAEKWSRERIIETLDKHAAFTWGIKDKMFPQAMVVKQGSRVFLEEMSGQVYMDMSSQAVCCNLGHTVPPSVLEAITDQLNKIAMVYGGTVMTEVRAKLCEKLAKIAPGDLNCFLFPCTGTDANEAAMRIARRVSGRRKVLCPHRGYVGSSLAALKATGDFRTQFVEHDSSYIKFQDPNPYLFSFGSTEEEVTAKALIGLEAEIVAADSDDVACIIMESIVGANGFIAYPKGYMAGVRNLCDKYGIFLIADEVMMGFGRTGKWFGINHYDVVPDMLTSAKGLTAGILPLSVVAISDDIHAKLRKIPSGWGTTYQAHPVSLACSIAVLEYIEDNDLIGRVQKLAPVFNKHILDLAARHEEVVMNPRSIGFGGSVDLRAPQGEDEIEGVYTAGFRGSVYNWSPKIGELRTEMMRLGVFSHVLGPHCNFAPPLITTEEELEWGFERIDKAFRCLYTD